MLVKILENSKVWPYTLQMLYSDNPNVSFPEIPSEALLNYFNVYTVLVDPLPEIENELSLNRLDPVLENGTYVQHWEVVKLT